MEVESYICPSCGSEVKIGKACPGCAPLKVRAPKVGRGKVARKPWQTDGSSDGLELPEEDFDYDDFVAREFGGKPHRAVGIRWHWWITALLLAIGFGALVLRGVF